MDSPLEAVQKRVCIVEGRLVKAEQDLAAAKEAKIGEEERKLFDLLLSLNNQLSGLQEEKNILLRGQAPGNHCFQLVVWAKRSWDLYVAWFVWYSLSDVFLSLHSC